ncbi:MAG TPA: PAS domain S-box protein [Negativicutes bacterium]|nr:PAS domain S-box protein [Negativicutes bacterium]
MNKNQRTEPVIAEQSEDLIMNHPLVMLVVNPENGQILYANSAAALFYGWKAEQLQKMKMTQLNLLTDESLRAKIELVKKHQCSFFIFQHRLADGQIRDVEVHIVPIKWKQRTAMYSIIIDITDRKQAEEAQWRCAEAQNVLRKIADIAARLPLMELYRAVHYQIGRLLPSTNIQIYLADQATGQLISPYLVDETGRLPKQRKIGKFLPEYVMRQRRTIHVTAEDYERLKKSGEVDFRLVPFKEWLGAPLIDGTGNVFGIIILLTLSEERSFQIEDVNFFSIVAAQLALAIGRKQSEEALRASEERFHQFVQYLPVPLVYGNRNKKSIEYVNEQFVQTFGYTLDEVPTTSKWWKLAYPNEKSRSARIDFWRNSIALAQKCKTNIEPTEVEITCKNGKIRPCMVTGTMVDDGFLVTFTDITERRRDERLLMASYERKRKNDLLNDLIHHDAPSPQVLSACERMLGNRVKYHFNCYLVVMNAYKEKLRKYWLNRRDVYQPLLDSIVDVLEDDKTIAWESADGLVILRFGDDPAHRGKAQQFKEAEEIIHAILRHEPEIDVSIGIAERVRSLSEIGSCYRQAFVSVHSGRKLWPQRKIFHYHDIGLLQLLPYVNDTKQLEYYIERILGPVLQYDKNKKVKLLPTLECIMLSDNLKSAAGMLSIHYKTLLFRKRQLEQILGVDLDDMDARITVGTAIKMLKLGVGKEE